MRLGCDPHNPVNCKHCNCESVYPACTVEKVEEIAGKHCLHITKSPYFLQTKRDKHYRQGNNKERLDEIGIGRSDKSAKKAVKDKGNCHSHHHHIRRYQVAGCNRNHLCCTLKHDTHVENEEGYCKNGIYHPHGTAISVFNDLADCSAFTPSVKWCDKPVERSNKHIFPLIPDGCKTIAECCSGLGNRHLGMCSHTECLAYHNVPFEFTPSPEITVACLYPARYPYTKRCYQNKISDEYCIVECGHTYIYLMVVGLSEDTPAFYKNPFNNNFISPDLKKNKICPFSGFKQSPVIYSRDFSHI